MKTRQGYVSNSSSSSFIICFSKDPTIKANLEADMGDCGSNYESWDDSPTGWEESAKVADQVFNDIMNTTPATKEEIMGELKSDAPYDWNERFPKDMSWEDQWKIRDERAEKYALDQWEKHKEFFETHHVYILSYADEGGEAALEHGNIFRNLPYARSVSHH